MDMKHLLLLPLLLLGTVSALHLENHALSVDSQESQADLSQDLEGSGEQKGELALTKEAIQPEGEEAEPLSYPNDLEDVDDGDDEEAMVSDPRDFDKDVQCPREEDSVQMVGGSEWKTWQYILVRTPKTFKGAQRVCREAYHGNLVSIHSPRSNHYILGMTKGLNQLEVWIGGFYKGWWLFKKFHWTDGSSWNFVHWAGGEPKHGKGSCVTLDTRGYWQRARCRKRLPFICSF